jgi:hypothetical protein
MSSLAYGHEGRRADSVLLNGAWEFVLDQGDQRSQTLAEADQLQWRSCRLPGELVPWSEENATAIRFFWIRRRFIVTPDIPVDRL